MMYPQTGNTPLAEFSLDCLPASYHPTFYSVYEKLIKWLERYDLSFDRSILNDFVQFYLLAGKPFLDHREAPHLCRLILAAHTMQQNLLFSTTSAPQERHIEVKWVTGELTFPFTDNRPVMGCLVGFNLLSRHEIFDEENILLALNKYLPELRLVQESAYCHASPHQNLKIFYFEVEKKDRTAFTLIEKMLLKRQFQEKVGASIQSLAATIFMGNNDEEIYKNALILGHEIQALDDLPQVSILLDQQTGSEVIFRIIVVHLAPLYSFSIESLFSNDIFTLEKTAIIRHLGQHPIEAHICRLRLPRDLFLLRSDGSLDFYAARHKVVTLVTKAVGEFRDYNGGILIKQQELLQDFKDLCASTPWFEGEQAEAFFYAITPLEKQLSLQKETLFSLYCHYQRAKQEALPSGSYAYKVSEEGSSTYLIIHADDSALLQIIKQAIHDFSHISQDIAYNSIETGKDVFFNAVLLPNNTKKQICLDAIQNVCQKWNQKKIKEQVLRIALGPMISLDPRIGGEVSTEVLKLLFEGLTRYDQNGKIENGAAEHIDISHDMTEYTFRLRPALWNDGSQVSAHDFAYSWKRILSPDFDTSFAHLFYSIKNAKESKEGKVPADAVGIQVLDDRTLKITLERPTPYFLQMTASTLYSPVHRLVDRQHPNWPYEADRNYPCNGPFQLKVNQPNQGFQLVKNPLYWDANQVTMDRITLTTMNPAQAVQAFRRDEVDWIGNPFGSWSPSYEPPEEKMKEINPVFFPDCWTSWCVFNTSSLPFNHFKLRQAFSYAIHRAQILNEIDLALTPAYSVLLPHYHRNAQNFFPEHSPDQARKLFQEALQSLNMSFEDFPQVIFICNEDAMNIQTAKCLKKQFETIFGIQCIVDPLPWSTLFHKMTNSEFHIGLMNWTSWVDDPIYTLNTFKFDQKLNFPKWENTEYQKLLDLSDQENNPFQRSAYQLKAEMVLSREMPVIPLYHKPVRAISKPHLKFVWKQPCGPINLSRTKWEK
jgi:oligopeptide transport system substrate-binding protein